MTVSPYPVFDDDDLDALPGQYAAAIRLARLGTSPSRIAAELGVPVESVAGLLVLAEAKLTALSGRRKVAPAMETTNEDSDDDEAR